MTEQKTTTKAAFLDRVKRAPEEVPLEDGTVVGVRRFVQSEMTAILRATSKITDSAERGLVMQRKLVAACVTIGGESLTEEEVAHGIDSVTLSELSEHVRRINRLGEKVEDAEGN